MRRRKSKTMQTADTPPELRLYTLEEARQLLNLGEHKFRDRWRDQNDPLRKYIITMGERKHYMRIDGIKAYQDYLAQQSLIALGAETA